MELLYICDLKDEWLDFIYTFPQLLPGLVAGALVRYVLCGVDINIYITETEIVDSTDTINAIRYSCHYFLGRILFHHDFHHDSCDYHWDFYGH